MFTFFREPKFNFMGVRRWAYLVSGVLFLGSLGVLLIKKPHWGIDFTGGTLLQIHVDGDVDIGRVRAAARAAGLSAPEVQNFGEKREFLIKYKEEKDPNEVAKALQRELGIKVRVDRNESVGPRIGRELREQAVIALSLGLLLMLIYIWIRFNFAFGLGAILALFHDVVITFGLYTIFGFDVTVATVAALLTIVGYSINDSIVVSDRIRERLRLFEGSPPLGKLAKIFNESINSTLGRTVITSLTTLLVLVSLLVLGGPVILDFAFALTIGVVVGTYSSIFVVASLVLDWERWRARRAKA